MIIDLTEYEIKAILEVRAADVDPNRVGKEEYGDWLRLCARIEALAFKAQGSHPRTTAPHHKEENNLGI